MAFYDQQAPVTAYPPPVPVYQLAEQPPEPGYVQSGPYVAPPPPIGYPTREWDCQNQHATAKTIIKGDGFCKGCLAALCCCCVLDVCCC